MLIEGEGINRLSQLKVKDNYGFFHRLVSLRVEMETKDTIASVEENNRTLVFDK